jgi:hypothetical protein
MAGVAYLSKITRLRLRGAGRGRRARRQPRGALPSRRPGCAAAAGGLSLASTGGGGELAAAQLALRSGVLIRTCADSPAVSKAADGRITARGPGRLQAPRAGHSQWPLPPSRPQQLPAGRLLLLRCGCRPPGSPGSACSGRWSSPPGRAATCTGWQRHPPARCTVWQPHRACALHPPLVLVLVRKAGREDALGCRQVGKPRRPKGHLRGEARRGTHAS